MGELEVYDGSILSTGRCYVRVVKRCHCNNTTSLAPTVWYTVQVELTCLLNPQEFPHHYTQHINAGKYNIAKYGSLPIMLRLTLTKEALM